MKKVVSTITINNKKYSYSLTKKDKNTVRVECVAANIDQDFLSEDIADLIIDLPQLILAEKNYQEMQTDVVRFRITPEDKNKIEKKAVAAGFRNVSEYLRSLALG